MQFSVSIGLGIVALVVFAQISYARNIDLGLNKNGIVVILAQGLPPSTLQSFVHALNADPHLNGATASSDVPFTGTTSTVAIENPSRPGTSVFHFLDTGPNFFSVYGIRLLSGRALSESFGKDQWHHDATSANVVINRTAAERLGYSPESALGKILFADTPQGIVKRVPVTIVGVTTDFKFEGERKEVVPTIYSYDPHDFFISVRVPPWGVQQGLSAIDAIWHRFAPSIAIDRYFLDRNFQRQFQNDEQQGRIFMVFVGVAAFIACLGLFGLAAFSTERRIKEIGIRKVYGAETKDIVLMLLWQFSIPVLGANLIAWPIAYYYLHGWLENYAYRISLNPLYFVGAGGIALTIAWVTVIAHAANVARSNPIHALRCE
jgi:putative ABC transport system permease protein